jgi:hypothetical protein
MSRRFCERCGAEGTAGSRFCLECGEALPAPAAALSTPAGEAAKPAFLRWLPWAGPLPLLLFFLPWVTVSCQTMGVSHSPTGWNLAAGFSVRGPFGQSQKVPGEPMLFLLLLAAIGLLAVAVAREHSLAGRIADTSAVALAAGGLLIGAVKYLQWTHELARQTGGLVSITPNAGLVLTSAAFLAAGAGGVLGLLSAPPAALSPSAVGGFCPACGARVHPGSVFCIGCGGRLTDTVLSRQGGDTP